MCVYIDMSNTHKHLFLRMYIYIYILAYIYIYISYLRHAPLILPGSVNGGGGGAMKTAQNPNVLLIRIFEKGVMIWGKLQNNDGAYMPSS